MQWPVWTGFGTQYHQVCFQEETVRDLVSVLLCGFQTWTARRIHALETKWLTWLLRISYIEHETNELVGSKVAALLGHQKLFFVTMMREAAQTGLIRPRDCRKTVENRPSGYLGGHADAEVDRERSGLQT